MLDCELYGLNPSGHHLTNLILHIANTLLLFLLLSRITRALWPSAVVAALFALHPLHVESVAWVAERKDVLSTFFWMTTMWAYVWYVEQPSLKRYWLIVLSYALGLMSKPMLVTLPFVLLLLDYWPLARFQETSGLRKGRKGDQLATGAGKILVRLLLEKVPLFALAIFSSLMTMLAQKQALIPLELIPLKFRLVNALFAYADYLSKMIWPTHLAVFYPHPGVHFSWWGLAVAGLILLGCLNCSILAITELRRHPYLAVGWFWYLGTLVPVIGLVQVGGQAMADRYTYIPLIGLFLIIVWGAQDLTARWHHQKIFLAISAGVVLISCGVVTWQQVSYWRSPTSLFEHAIAVTKNNWLAYDCLGFSYAKLGRTDEAIGLFQKAIKINPKYANPFFNLGDCLTRQGMTDQAMGYLKEAIRLRPNFPEAHFMLAVALQKKDKVGRAVAQYQEALSLKPDYWEALNNLAYILATSADPKFRDGAKAVQLAEKANQLRRYSVPEMMDTLAAAYAEVGRFSEAIATSEKARELARSAGKANEVKAIEEKIRLYQEGRPYHEPGKQ